MLSRKGKCELVRLVQPVTIRQASPIPNPSHTTIRLFYTTSILLYLVFFRLSSPSSLLARRRTRDTTDTCGAESKTETVGTVTFCYFSGFLDEPRNEGSLTAPSSPLYHISQIATNPSQLRYELCCLESIEPTSSENRKLTRVSKYPAPLIQPYLFKIRPLPSSRSRRDISSNAIDNQHILLQPFYLVRSRLHPIDLLHPHNYHLKHPLSRKSHPIYPSFPSIVPC